MISLILNSLLCGGLLASSIYIIQKLFGSEKRDLLESISIMIINMLIVYILYALFGYLQLILGIHITVLIYIISIYCIDSYLKIHYEKELVYFRVENIESEKLDEIKKEIINNLTQNKQIKIKLKPQVEIIQSKGENKKYKTIMTTVWFHKESSIEKYVQIVKGSISKYHDIVGVEEYIN